MTVQIESVFWSHARSRRLELDDGRSLIVQYGSERSGWFAWCAENKLYATTPREAMLRALGLDAIDAPDWVTEVAHELEAEHAALEAGPHYPCECCGFATLVSEGHYDICPVCFWEDDRADSRPDGIDTPSGPNRVTLRQARANFAAFGACDERGRAHVRPPRPRERDGWREPA